MTMTSGTNTHDVIVIGSGIGGLSCAGLLAKAGLDVLVLESHTTAGGAAHGFRTKGYYFDTGPSLFSGMSSTSHNPMRSVLSLLLDDDRDRVGDLFIPYSSWGLLLPEGDFSTKIGPGFEQDFPDLIRTIRGDAALQQWKRYCKEMRSFSDLSHQLDPSSLRILDHHGIGLPGMISSLISFLPTLGRHIFRLGTGLGPSSTVIDQHLADPFLRNWMDLLCMLLSGVPARGTPMVELAFMFDDWYGPRPKPLDYPKGGSKSLVEAYLAALKRYGGSVRLKSHVESILFENGRATGVRLSSGQGYFASKAVVSNASVWDTCKMLDSSDDLSGNAQLLRQEATNLEACRSFTHLHLGVDVRDLTHPLHSHYIFVDDWSRGVDAEMNVVVISIPSVLDHSLAPEGKHCIHAYTPATEPYEIWFGLEPGSAEYLKMKEERTQILWKALKRVIPDIESRAEVKLIGSPLTHERFLRRDRGSYGPAVVAGKDILPFPPTLIPGLHLCGDCRFPGIGLPAVSASGMITANGIMSKSSFSRFQREVKMRRRKRV